MVNQLENYLSVGQLVQKCKDDIRTTLNGLKALYQPCNFENIHEITQDLIEVLNKVIGDFIDDNRPEEIPPENDEASVIKSENGPDNVITIDSDDEITIKEEDWQFNRHNDLELDTQMPNARQSNVLAKSVNIPKNSETPAKKIKSKKRPSENTEFIHRNGKKHRRSNQVNEDSLVCEICHKRATSTSRLIYHRKKHLKEFPIHCRICLRYFLSDQERNDHEKNCDKFRYDCYACGMILDSMTGLKIHFRTHTGDRPFKCMKCDMTFAYEFRLRIHIKRGHKKTSRNSINKKK